MKIYKRLPTTCPESRLEVMRQVWRPCLLAALWMPGLVLAQGLARVPTASPSAESPASVPVLADLLVQSGRLEQRQFDAAASVTAIDAETLRSSGPQVNLSDALSRVPGVVALNRNNYAQDVQISIRGFGSRAAFGLRGIRLLTDGIPATIPDGQGQASTVSLTSTDRIEVLTGPLAQIYGNASGGVIQTFTREAGPEPEAQVQLFAGSYGMTRTDWQLSGRSGDKGQVGIVADYSTFGIDGYRQNSDARRQQLNTVITVDSSLDTRWKFVANIFDMPYAKDPLGLTATELSDPTAAGKNALKNGTRKTVQQDQWGLVLEHRIERDVQLQARVYSGQRSNLQYQAAGNWVELHRRYEGLGLQFKGKSSAGSMPFDWIVGWEQDQAGEQRTGGDSPGGIKNGVISRNEWNEANSQGGFAQANWMIDERLTLTTGVRRSLVTLKSRDDLPTPVDGSGIANYAATSPVLGLTWHVTDHWNVYANQGRGFETPTMAEAAYSATYVADNSTPPRFTTTFAERFNPALLASTSTHREVGSKWMPSAMTRVDLAWFRIETENEIVSALTQSGKTAYVNATRTHRAGMELSWRQVWTPHWKSLLSATALQATYDQSFTTPSSTGTVMAGNALPAIPARQAFASLSWSQAGFMTPTKGARAGFEASLDWLARSALWVNDRNSESAPGYGVFNARLRHLSQWDRMTLVTHLGIDNLGNRNTIGSVIVNQTAGQYYEPSPPRTWLLGVQARLPL
jgi:iron complex outermembrane receptor protein